MEGGWKGVREETHKRPVRQASLPGRKGNHLLRGVVVGGTVILAPPKEDEREGMEVGELFPQEVLEGGGPGPPWGCTSVL